MRFLGTIFILLALGALALDFLASQSAVDGAFALRSLDTQLTSDLGLGDAIAGVRGGFADTVLGLPGVAVLGGVGVVLFLLSSILFGRRD